ncbi:MAG: hypothetical protein Q4G64_03100 [bacterium]|nr:hypothetical protein [bacterium]
MAKPQPQDADPSSAIIALPAQAESAAEGKSLLPASMLDTLVFPERDEEAPRAERKKPRRAVASGGMPPGGDVRETTGE